MSELDFLPMCAFFFITAATLPSWINLPSKNNETVVPDVLTPLHFRVMYASLFVLACLVVVNALGALYENTSHHNKTDDNSVTKPNYFMAGLIIFVWIGPIIAQVYLPQKSDYLLAPTGNVDGRNIDEREEGEEQETLLDTEEGDNTESSKQGGSALSTGRGDSEDNLEGDIAMEPISSQEESDSVDEFLDDDDEEEDRYLDNEANDHAFRNDKNLFQMLQTPEAWMMLWSGTILCGAGTVETNNLGQMVEALGFSKVVVPATLALFSVAQSGGRVITGALSEAALTYETRRCCIDQGIPRPFFFVVASIASVLAHMILVLATEEVSFVFGVTLAGVAFGMAWPLLVLCVGEIFGNSHIGSNYMFYDGVTSAAGTFMLSKVVAQQVYEEHISGDGVICIGQGCFRQTHVAIVILSMTCIVTSAMMQYKTRDVYNKTGSRGGQH
jgi:hypothetical protein